MGFKLEGEMGTGEPARVGVSGLPFLEGSGSLVTTMATM